MARSTLLRLRLLWIGRRNISFDLVDERDLVSCILVFDRLQDVGRDHPRIGGLQCCFDRVAVYVSFWGSGRVMTIEASGLADNAIWLNVVQGNESSPKRRLCSAKGCGGQDESEHHYSKGLHAFTNKQAD